jgi:Ras GTPase-activating-like protein IQGAP2/3
MINQIEEETGTLPPNLPRGVAPEVAAENIDVQALIAPRLTMLMEIANSFLLTIIESMESVPYGIRWICKQIRSLTRVGLTHPKTTMFLPLIKLDSENILKRRTMPSVR